MADDTIAALLNQVPALDADGKFTGPLPPTMQTVFDGCLAAGAAGLRAVIDQVKEVDNGEDYRARYVLHGLAVYVCSPERAEPRRLLTSVLAGEVAGPRPAAVRGYLVRQLQVCGTRDQVPALSALLVDPELAESAAQAIQAIGGGAAAFREALGRAPAANRRTLVQALTVLQDAETLPALRQAVTDADADVRIAASLGLARLGDRGSVDLLLKAADAQGFERFKLTKSCLVLAERLLAAKQPDDALRVYQHLYRTRTAPAEAYVRDLAQAGMMAAGFRDPSPPELRGPLTAEAVGLTALKLSWPAATDADSGVWQYTLSRDGQPLAVVGPTAAAAPEFVDTTVEDGKTYAYAVRAVNLGKTESAPLEARVPFFDVTPPKLLSAACNASAPDRVRLVFSKPLEAAAAGTLANYALSGDTKLTSATVSESGLGVDLRTAAPLAKGATATITAKGLTDRATKRNPLAAGSTATFTVLDRLPGIRFACYEEVLGDELAPYEKAKPKAQGVATKVDVSVRTRDDQFSLRFEGLVAIPAEGEFIFYTTSDDGSRLYIDGAPVVKNDGPHSSEEKSGTVRLTAGDHRLTVTFFEGGGGEELKATWQGPGVPKQEIPPAALFHLQE